MVPGTRRLPSTSSPPLLHAPRPLGGSVAPSLAGRRHFPRPGERREDARVLGILDAPGTRRPPPPAQPRGSRAAQPARCGLAAGFPPLPAEGTSREKAGFTFFTSKIGADIGFRLHAPIYSPVLRDEGEIRETRGLFLTQEPVNCLPVAPSSSATPPSVLRASTPHLLSQSIAREPNPRRTCPGAPVSKGPGPTARLACAAGRARVRDRDTAFLRGAFRGTIPAANAPMARL